MLSNLTCDMCRKKFEPQEVWYVTSRGDDNWRNPTESEVYDEMDEAGWWNDDFNCLCDECVRELEESGVYPEDWEDRESIKAELQNV